LPMTMIRDMGSARMVARGGLLALGPVRRNPPAGEGSRTDAIRTMARGPHLA
jgi:hypothetical protein